MQLIVRVCALSKGNAGHARIVVDELSTESTQCSSLYQALPECSHSSTCGRTCDPWHPKPQPPPAQARRSAAPPVGARRQEMNWEGQSPRLPSAGSASAGCGSLAHEEGRAHE